MIGTLTLNYIDTDAIHSACSGCPENDVRSTVSLNDVAHASNWEGKGSIFKGLLHLTAREEAKIPTRASRGAVTEESNQRSADATCS